MHYDISRIFLLCNSVGVIAAQIILNISEKHLKFYWFQPKLLKKSITIICPLYNEWLLKQDITITYLHNFRNSRAYINTHERCFKQIINQNMLIQICWKKLHMQCAAKFFIHC